MEETGVFEKYLLPKLREYIDFLSANGIRAEMSMDKDRIPGLLVFAREGSFFLTFVPGEQEAPEIMRITAIHGPSGKEISPEEIIYRSLLVDASKDIEAADVMKYAQIAMSERVLEPYPTRDMVVETWEDDEGIEGLVNGATSLEFDDEADDEGLGEELAVTGENAAAEEGFEEGAFSLNDGAMLAPRINALLSSLLEGGIEDAQAVYAGVPYIIAVDGEAAFICAFEATGDNEYLLHFRADVPYDAGEDMESLKEKVRTFNDEHYFVRCSLDFGDIGIYEDESENVITFFACTPDEGSVKVNDVYGYFGALFEAEYMEFFE